ncbi:MAG: hypothetical protein ACTSSE_17225 [Candidatus Thorarchaeota archaeon]
MEAYIERSLQRSMRGTSNNLTCYDCRECIDAQGTSHGFCKIEKAPIGGLDWNDEDFDKFPAHIPPRIAGDCWKFGPSTPFALRTAHLVIYVTTAERLREVFGNLIGGSTK